ncbi:sulfatase [Bythopirellula goksoeyrii]|uniref:Arylsulfatase n=1 Tax=Bythopirellula goksoeyrii TaxID=1400387 RepID=A0A5B9QN36_9BACT|nr:sulfatase [Bythopirellula goksoeyrii]QEG35413.1 Arylsulfatase [Bythopirellula goksoeyrii]
MTRSNFLVSLALGIILSACSIGQTATADDSTPRQMNVLLIISDDLRTELGCYGSELAKTPCLDALAAKGVRFDRAYCQFPLCNPSRSSMLTSRRPTTLGVFGNRTWFGTENPQIVSLPKYFRQHGYDTFRAGKIFHGGIDDAKAWTRGGQDRYYGTGATAEVPLRRLNQASAEEGLGPTLTKAQRSDRWIVLNGDGEKSGDYQATDRAIAYLRDAGEQPFFLSLGLSKPHSPLEAPQQFFDRFDVDQIPLPVDFAPRPTVPDGFPSGSIRPKNADLFIGRDASPQEAREMIRAYLASTAWVDWNVGRLLDVLEESGMSENTIVIFWGDHGYQLGEKGKWSKAGSLWEQGIRVPLLIYDPRVRGNGEACPRVVESIDIYPTLINLCGLPADDQLEGRSLSPLLSNPQSAWDYPAYSVWSEDGNHVTGVSVRTERWHYAEYYGRGAGAFLTEPAVDPHEMTNLVEQMEYAQIVNELSRLARDHTASHRPPD